MSHTNHTQYYELPQYVGSDIINPLVDTNGAYETIDTAMHNIAEEAGQGTTDIAALQSKVGSGVFETTAQNATDAVNEIVGELDTADTGIKARLAGAESDIDTLQSQMVTAQGNITDLQNNKANASDVSALQTTVGILNGYHAKIPANVEYLTVRQEVSVTADGVKTCGELLRDLHNAVQTFVDSLVDNERIEILQCSLNDHAYSMTPIAKFFNTKNTTVGNLVFEKTNNTPSNITFYSAGIRGDESSYYYEHTLSVADSSLVVTTYTDTVPAQGVHYGILCQKYIKVTKS